MSYTVPWSSSIFRKTVGQHATTIQWTPARSEKKQKKGRKMSQSQRSDYYHSTLPTVRQKMHTLVVADSCGAGFQGLLEVGSDIGVTEIHVHKGAGIVEAVCRSMHTIQDWRPDLIIMMAGICDVMERDRITKRTRLRHNNIQDVEKE